MQPSTPLRFFSLLFITLSHTEDSNTSISVTIACDLKLVENSHTNRFMLHTSILGSIYTSTSANFVFISHVTSSSPPPYPCIFTFHPFTIVLSSFCFSYRLIFPLAPFSYLFPPFSHAYKFLFLFPNFLLFPFPSFSLYIL